MRILIANWKANPTTLDEALGLFDFYLAEMQKYQNIQLIVCPPFVYLEELYKRQETSPPSASRRRGRGDKRQVNLGAQDLFWEQSGPYTGEISTDMLKNFDVSHVLVGHSDRRYKIGEGDEVISKKVKAAIEADIIPVLLVGEKNQGDDRKVVLEQRLSADLIGLTADQISKVLITYEPVWAISTTPGAEPDTPEYTLAALKIIKEFLARNFQFPRPRLGSAEGGPISNFRLLYGGSINENNVADFLKHPELSGAVIGGASLHKEEFANILKNVNNLG